jgi:hypothetical protein
MGADARHRRGERASREFEMKSTILSLALLSMWTVLASAQSTSPSNPTLASVHQSPTVASQPTSASNHDLRGCLEGTKGNYTLVDHQNKTHKVTGNDHLLWDDVGHEVDMTGNVGAGDVFQETKVTDIASRCWNFHLN